MGFYWVKTSSLIKKCFPRLTWDIPNSAGKVYLTFDDGPTPDITEWVLDVLEQHTIKATFFCIGNNIEKNPGLFSRIVNEGHAIGNHTFNHLNGWNIDNKEYMENVAAACNSIVTRHPGFLDNMLFRPPYGKIKAAQSAKIREKGYRIIMWDVLSADFDQAIAPEKCLHNVVSKTTSGSIIIFHDSIKAKENLQYALPRAIEYLKQQGFIFDKIA